jgi:membrane fusion protein (multidrug efflux system)
VLVVGADDKVAARRVALGEADGAQVVIRSGLNEGERIIVESIQKVRPGVAVTASEAPPSRAPQGEGQSQQFKG